jgi:phosphatidylinositol alpha-mannosyltransferase
VVPYDLAERGGVKHHAHDLAAALRAGGDEVLIVGPSSTPIDRGTLDGSRIPPRRGFGGQSPPAPHASDDAHTRRLGGVINVRSNGSDNRLALLVSPLAVWRFFRRERFDVVHVHEPPVPSLPYWTAWFARHMPQVCTFHAYAEHSPPLMRVARRLWAGLQFGFFQRGIAVSQAAADYTRLTWKRPLTIVPNGVRTDLFRPADQPRAADDGPLRLLFVGRIGDARKGFACLLAAYEALRARGVPVTLDVVGELGGAPLPAPRPGLTYHGPLPLHDLIARYRACDLFVAPSTGQESFGIVLAEAMACGRPIVCSDIDGYRRTVDERGACLVPPRDPEALAAAIARLAARPEERWRMGAINRDKARSYDWTRVAAQVREVYEAAIEDRAARGPRAVLPAAEPSVRRRIGAS